MSRGLRRGLGVPGHPQIPFCPRKPGQTPGRSRAGSAGRGSCFPGNVRGPHCAGQGRSSAGCAFPCAPCSGSAIFNPEAELLFLQGRLSAAPRDVPASLSHFGGSGSAFWGRPLLPIPAVLGQPLFPGRGHGGAGSCRRPSAGNAALPALRTTSEGKQSPPPPLIAPAAHPPGRLGLIPHERSG